MSSMRNHRKRSHRSEKIHQSGRMGTRAAGWECGGTRPGPLCPLPTT